MSKSQLAITQGGTGAATASAALTALGGVATSALKTVATTGNFSDLLLKPTTLAGYGITDAADLGNNIFTGNQMYTAIDKGTIASGTVTFDFSTGDIQRLQVNGALTIALSNFPATGIFCEMAIELVNGGLYTITWPTINWVTSTGATTMIFASNGVTLQSAGTDWVMLWTRTGSTTVYGRIIR